MPVERGGREGTSRSRRASGWPTWWPHWWPVWLTPGTLFTAVVAIWLAPRCIGHLAAVAGVSDGAMRRPTFAVATRDGRVLTQDSLRGRVVLVNVWATWCMPCRAEMPALRQLAAAWASGSVVVLGLSVDRGPASDVDRFLAERAITYPVAIVGDEILRAFGGVRAYPTSFLIDRAGVVRHTVVGPIAPLTLRPALARLVREPASSP